MVCARRPPARHAGVERPGLRGLATWLGLRDRGRGPDPLQGLGARTAAPDLPDPPRRGPRRRPADRAAVEPPRVRLAGAPALGNRRGEAARGQRRPLPREDAVVGARADDPGRDRPPRRPDPPHRGPARRAAAAHRRPGAPPRGGAALPDGRRLHARLGVLEASRRDVRLRVTLVRAPHRLRGRRVLPAPVACSTRSSCRRTDLGGTSTGPGPRGSGRAAASSSASGGRTDRCGGSSTSACR